MMKMLKNMKFLEFLKNHKGKLEEVFGSARRASESCWRPLRLLNRNETKLEKVHKECFAQTVDGAPSTAPSLRRLFGREKQPAVNSRLE
jgi:hypothetical protein